MSEAKKGRPTKCTPEMIADIAQRVSEGVSLSRAAEGAGTSATRVSEWMQRGEEVEYPYSVFRDAINAAEYGFERRNLEVIQRAATEPTVTKTEHITELPDGTIRKEVVVVTKPPAWTPAAWLLERRLAQHYAKLERRHHEGGLKVEESGPREVRITFVQAPKSDGVESVELDPTPEGETST